ncbi:MAG: type II CAAX endopeptidase family protein [Steroidobacteraceae bacterium]
MRDWSRHHPFLSFYLLAIAFPVVLFAYLAVMEAAAPDFYRPGVGVYRHFFDTMEALLREHPLLALHRDSVLVFVSTYALVPLAAPFLFFPFGPTASALIVTGVARGGAAVRALLGALAPMRGKLTARDGLRIYGLVLVTIAGLVAASLLVDLLATGGARIAALRRTWGLDAPAAFLAGWSLALFTNQGGLLEELGWRGYAWPVLARSFRRPLVAATLLGIAWALWHFPREIAPLLAGEQSLAHLVTWQLTFIAACVGMTVVAVTFVNYTGGSVLPAIMIHGTLNFLYQGFETGRTGVRSDMTWEPTVVWVVAALVVLAMAGPELGWRRRMQINGGDGRSDPSNLWALPAKTDDTKVHA